MANDWIKMRTDLYRDPKVIVMADSMLDPDGELASFIEHNCRRNMTVTRNVTRNACVGALLSVWGVMRHRGVRVGDDLECHGITLAVVDDIADLPGFGKAMQHVGWIENSESGLIFPRFFADYNVEPDEKNKSKNAERQARYREKLKAKSNVTSNVTRNVTVTPREEESREEKSIKTPLIPQGGDAPKDVPSTGKKPKRVRNQETVGEWSIPHGWDSERLRDALGAFERMRTSIGHRIKDRANLSRVFKSFDNAEHLIYAIDFATSNEYQGIKPDYRPPVTKPEPKKEKELPMITELPPEIVAIYTRQAEERRKRNEEFERKRHDESMRRGVDMRDPEKAV